MIIQEPHFAIPTEQECVDILKSLILSSRLECGCGNNQFYWKNDKTAFECKKCGKRQSLKVNSMMSRSRLPIHCWVVILHYRLHKKDFPITQIQHLLKLPYYQAVFNLCLFLDTQILRITRKDDDFFSRHADQNIFMEDDFDILSQSYMASTEKDLLTFYLKFLSNPVENYL